MQKRIKIKAASRPAHRSIRVSGELSNRRQLRSETGSQLVELMIAIMMAGVVSTAIIGTLSGMLRYATAGQNQVCASDVAQQLIDAARNMTWTQVVAQANAGVTHTMLVNRQSAGDAVDPVFPRPLMQDLESFDYWRDSTTGSTVAPAFSNRFKADAADGGSVTERFLWNPDGTIRVVVTVTWLESNGATRSLQQSTVISQNGIHN